MKFDNMNRAIELNSKLQKLKENLAGMDRAYFDPSLKVQLIGDLPKDKDDFLAYMLRDMDHRVHSKISIPVNDVLKDALFDTLRKIMAQQIAETEGELRELGVDF